MNKNKRPQIAKMPHSGHNKHLCHLVNLGFNDRKARDYNSLVREPKFICRKCGRGAKSGRNLCNPIKL